MTTGARWPITGYQFISSPLRMGARLLLRGLSVREVSRYMPFAGARFSLMPRAHTASARTSRRCLVCVCVQICHDVDMRMMRAGPWHEINLNIWGLKIAKIVGNLTFRGTSKSACHMPAVLLIVPVRLHYFPIHNNTCVDAQLLSVNKGFLLLQHICTAYFNHSNIWAIRNFQESC